MSKKPEKLASAVYLISSFFADQEPMKWRLRALASDMVAEAVSLKGGYSTDETQTTLRLKRIVSELSGLLSVARDSGLVSDANFGIISKEFESLVDTLSLPDGLREEQGSTILAIEPSKSIEDRAEASAVDKDSQPVQETKSTEENVEKDKYEKSSYRTEQNERESELLDTSELENVSKREKPAQLREFGAVSVKKNSRKSIIISLLKRKKEIMIKDVSPLISGCSDKTIQRELAGLVKEGVLRKEGEKRWSKYSLA